MKILLVSFLNIVIYTSVYNQITLKGKVVDATTKEPLIGANVYLQSDLMNGTYSDENGYFNLLARERDTLYISYIGYQTFVRNLDPAVKIPSRIEMQANTQILQVAEIKAKKIIAEEFATESLSKLDIYLNPNAKADALLAVQSLAASTNVDETANISLRGSPAFETGIYLNNVPIRDAVRLDQVNGVGRFSIFNTAMLESVTVFPSNPLIEFGGSTSGAVVIETENSMPVKMNSISLNLVGGGVLLSRPIRDNTGLTIYSNGSSHQGLKGLNPNSLKDINAFSTLDVGMNLVHHFGPGTQLKVFNYGLFEQYDYQFRHPTYVGSFQQEKLRNLTIANFSHRWGKNQLDINQSFTISDSEYGAGNFDYLIDTREHFTSLNYHRLQDQWSLKAGFSMDAVYESFDAEVPVFDHALGIEHPNFPVRNTQKLFVPELYLYQKLKMDEWVIVGGGIRYHPKTSYADSYLARQLNTTFKFAEQHQLRASTGQYHKIGLPRGESPNPVTKIQSSHYALDYQFEVKGLKINAAIYHKLTKRTFSVNPIWGGELAFNYQANNLDASFSIAHIQSTIKTAELEYPSDFDLNYFIRSTLKYDIPDWFEISLIYLHRPGRFAESVTGSTFHEPTDAFIPIYSGMNARMRLAAYKIIDWSVSRIFPVGNGSMVTFLNVGNVLDFKNVRNYRYNPDYSDKEEEWFSRRVIFVGGVYNF